jgi:cell division protein FtsB
MTDDDIKFIDHCIKSVDIYTEANGNWALTVSECAKLLSIIDSLQKEIKTLKNGLGADVLSQMAEWQAAIEEFDQWKSGKKGIEDYYIIKEQRDKLQKEIERIQAKNTDIIHKIDLFLACPTLFDEPTRKLLLECRQEIERPQVREGYVMVPREPNASMLPDKIEILFDWPYRDIYGELSKSDCYNVAIELYKAMIQAAEGKE